ncbi:MAG: hypothetical protein ACRDXB_08630, partial [Actinomycetes bacterium]
MMARDAADAVVARRTAVLQQEIDSFGPNHSATVRARVGLAVALAADHQYAAAVRESTEVVRVRDSVLGATDPETILARRLLVTYLARNGEWGRAAAVYEPLIEASMAAWGPKSYRTLGSRVNFCNCLKRIGRNVDAGVELREILA